MSKVLSIDDMLSGRKSRYALAVGVAKRAREITDEMYMKGLPITEKTVVMAAREFENHECEIIEPDESEEN